MSVIKRLWSWIRGLFAQEPARHRTVVVEDVPEQLRDGDVYLVGENGHFWCVALLCPCRCGEVIQLNLVKGTRPLWTFERESGTDAITLRPSVWRTNGCRSHFFLRAGRVRWCDAQASPSTPAQ